MQPHASLTGVAAAVVVALAITLAATAAPGTARPQGCVLHLDRFAAIGCQVTASDSGRPDATRRWGSVECEQADRARHLTGTGDGLATSGGKGQQRSGYRRLHVVDGDYVYGERCELGRNSHLQPTFSNYYEGEHKVTFVSMRFPESFPLGRDRWQTVVQMKQAQPSTDGRNGPVLELQAFDGRFVLQHDWQRIWTAPAEKDRWIRIAFDVVYSRDPAIGSVQLHLDLNNDGDARDPHEHSPTFHVNTLNTETTGSEIDQLEPGASIPSHLRAGIYHDPAHRCPPPDGCAVDIDNVQVVDAG